MTSAAANATQSAPPARTRQVVPADRRAVQAMLARCSSISLQRRFGTTAPALQHFADSVVSRTAVTGIGAWVGEQLVGIGTVHFRADGPEFALLVEDGWHRHGVGTQLITEMCAEAVRTGWRHAVVELLVTNTAARQLVKASCTHVWFSAPDAGLVTGFLLLRPLGT